MDKLDYAILDSMANAYQAISDMRSTTRKRISLKLNAKGSDTIYRRLIKLINKGYVKKGIPEGREHTYYVTPDGIKALKEASK